MAVDELFSSAGPVVRVVARNGAPAVLDSGTISSSSGVAATAGMDAQALRFSPGVVRVSGVGNVTADRAFTVFAWVRTQPSGTKQRIIGRENGSTGIGLSVTSAGFPQFELRSTNGGWSVTVPGATRVDDGKWHLLVAVVMNRRGFLSIDTGGVDVVLYVDGEVAKTGYIDPGLFGASVELGMGTNVILGEDASGAARFVGDVQVAGIGGVAVTSSQVASMWEGRPVAKKAADGWGIILG